MSKLIEYVPYESAKHLVIFTANLGARTPHINGNEFEEVFNLINPLFEAIIIMDINADINFI